MENDIYFEFYTYLFHKNFNFEKVSNILGKLRSLKNTLDYIKNNFSKESDNKVKETLEVIKKENIKILFFDSKDYPEQLKNIKNPPIALFVKGNFPKGFYFSIVGSRRPSAESTEIAKHFTKELVKREAIIISGLARGIDGIVHRETLNLKGKTVAVLGSGHLKIYPPEHRFLAKQIEDSGALISEFPPFIPPNQRNFPLRNRIISGLSRGVLLIQAGFKSGSLKTANFAVEEGRELFCVPGNVYDMSYSGSNYLIKKGAKLVQTIEDILEEFPNERFEKVKEEKEEIEITNEERKILELFPYGKKIHFEELLQKFSFEFLSINLTSLELKNLIEKLPGNFFIKKFEK